MTFDVRKWSMSGFMEIDHFLPRMAGFRQAFGIRPCGARLPVKGAVCAGGRASVKKILNLKGRETDSIKYVVRL